MATWSGCCSCPPFFCSRHRYYDSMLNKLDIVGGDDALFNNRVDVDGVWEVFRNIFIDECFNKGSIRKWTSIPFLNRVDSPCDTGSVILLTRQIMSEKLTRQPNNSFFAGTVIDFHPESERYPQITPTRVTGLKGRNYMRVYQSKHSEKEVTITLIVEEILDIEHKMALENLHIDLDNFEGTGIQHKYCYVVTKVITGDLTIEMTNDGEVFFEMAHESVPICLQAAKVHVRADSSGLLKRIKHVTGVLRLKYFRRGHFIQQFLNRRLPNQNRLGKMSGNVCFDTTRVQKNLAIKSYRPQKIPRQDRPENNLSWKLDDIAQVESLRYCRRGVNGRLYAAREGPPDVDPVDYDVHTFYPMPQCHAVKYEDLEL